ncbi:MAG: Mov34/MPN/PAD-1 family protein [Candidatus Diapherotrites archaeon]|nr:Mov34/MPN/PAD-1 family protein [Candidatus Diapherotrites archaeon]
MKIKEDTLDFILEACRNTYPNEFLGLLRAKGGTITEVLLIPGSKFEHTSSTLRRDMVPLDPTIVGSVHSHPGRPIPSKADLNFFSKFGKIHLIVGYPFTRDTIAVFGPERLEIVK